MYVLSGSAVGFDGILCRGSAVGLIVKNAWADLFVNMSAKVCRIVRLWDCHLLESTISTLLLIWDCF